MKSILQNTWLRAVCVLALGILLVVYSESVPEWIVMVLGVLFIVPGSAAIVAWFARRGKGDTSAFAPLIGLGSICFGLILLLMPGAFVKALMYLLSAVLLIGGATQCYSFWNIRRSGIGLHAISFVVPVITLCAGLYCLFRPSETASLPFLIIGAACILHALMDLCSVFVVWRSNRRRKAELKAIEKIEEAEAEEVSAE